MSTKLHFLGTSCMVPTKDRNHLSTALEYEGNIFLFDCGENTQKQIKLMKLSIGKIRKIFISHWHGDHVLGLPGLIQTLSNTDNVKKIEIYGPVKSKKFVKHMLECTIFESSVPIEVFEFSPNKGEILTVVDEKTYEITCSKLNHSVPCNAYAFKRKDSLNVDIEKARELGLENNPLLAQIKEGKSITIKDKHVKPEDITYMKKGVKICFVFDTRPCEGIDLLVKDCDYLVMEATFLYSKHADKAQEYDHMSAYETAMIAKKNNVGTLLLTHFSQRYKKIDELEEEAKAVFPNTVVASDLLSYKIKK